MKYRWLILGLALAAAAALAVSVQAGRWWTIGGDLGGLGSGIEIGPFGSRSADRGSFGLSWAGGGVRWERFAAATWAGGMIAMLVLLIVAAAAAANRAPRLAARTGLVALATASAAAIGFVVTRPVQMPFAVDRGLYLFIAGIAAGVVGAMLAVRSARAQLLPARR